MFCTNCGQQLPDDANFCSACGNRITRNEGGGQSDGTEGETTTASIDVGIFDQHEGLEHLPDLEPGTGMLVAVRGPNAGSRFLLDRDVTTVGRHPDSHIFLDDVTVSRRHAEISRQDDDLTVRDLGSLNGTYVNGDRVEERLLRTGDEVQVGRFKLMYVGAGSTP